MHTFKAFLALALAVPALANPLLRRQCAETCGSTCYSQDDINAAVQQGYSDYEDGTTVGNDGYPHEYHDYEGFTFPDAGPYYEFPILSDEEVYTGGSPGADRVIFTGSSTLTLDSHVTTTDEDIKFRNNYNVVNCGENANHVFEVLGNLSTALLPVIEDAKSTPPSPAYTTFLKDPDVSDFISTLLTNISTGVPMGPPSGFSLNGGVIFFCVTEPGQFKWEQNRSTDGYHESRDSYNDCMARPLTHASFLRFPSNPYVVICPAFFTRNVAALPPPNHCLSVNTYTNSFRGSGQSFWLFQIWILMDMIAHYYLWASTSAYSALNTHDANTLFRLAPWQCRLSANSYVFYAASIYGHCRRFPKPYDDNRELLEVDPTTPAANASFVSDPTAVEWNATDLRIDGQPV